MSSFSADLIAAPDLKVTISFSSSARPCGTSENDKTINDKITDFPSCQRGRAHCRAHTLKVLCDCRWTWS